MGALVLLSEDDVEKHFRDDEEEDEEFYDDY